MAGRHDPGAGLICQIAGGESPTTGSLAIRNVLLLCRPLPIGGWGCGLRRNGDRSIRFDRARQCAPRMQLRGPARVDCEPTEILLQMKVRSIRSYVPEIWRHGESIGTEVHSSG
jgi:hypothetical protein